MSRFLLSAGLLGLGLAMWLPAGVAQMQLQSDPYAEPVQDPYAEPTAVAPDNCVFMIDDIDPTLLTVEERIALLDRQLNDTLGAHSQCMSMKQTEAAEQAGQVGGVGSNGAGATGAGGAGAGGSGQLGNTANTPNAGQQQSGAEGQTASEGSNNEAQQTANGRVDQGVTQGEPDAYVCNYLRGEIERSPDAQAREQNEQAARDYGCRV